MILLVLGLALMLLVLTVMLCAIRSPDISEAEIEVGALGKIRIKIQKKPASSQRKDKD